jgi:hypothetical protein
VHFCSPSLSCPDTLVEEHLPWETDKDPLVGMVVVLCGLQWLPSYSSIRVRGATHCRMSVLQERLVAEAMAAVIELHSQGVVRLEMVDSHFWAEVSSSDQIPFDQIELGSRSHYSSEEFDYLDAVIGYLNCY